MKPKLLLIGAGGHCKVVLDTLIYNKEYEVSGIIDLKDSVGSRVFGVPVIGVDLDLPRLRRSGIKRCFIAVGSIGSPQPRIRLYNIAKKSGYIFPNLISPHAKVSCRAILGEGNYIAPGAIINAGAEIGNQCIINTGVIIEHDCKIGDFVHISPGSVLSGGVVVGCGSHVGTGSIIIHNVRIGAGTIIGAGSVVTKNISKDKIAYGNPCKERKKNA